MTSPVGGAGYREKGQQEDYSHEVMMDHVKIWGYWRFEKVKHRFGNFLS